MFLNEIAVRRALAGGHRHDRKDHVPYGCRGLRIFSGFFVLRHVDFALVGPGVGSIEVIEVIEVATVSAWLKAGRMPDSAVLRALRASEVRRTDIRAKPTGSGSPT